MAQFHLDQAKLRAARRLREGRARPIDQLVRLLHLADEFGVAPRCPPPGVRQAGPGGCSRAGGGYRAAAGGDDDLRWGRVHALVGSELCPGGCLLAAAVRGTSTGR